MLHWEELPGGASEVSNDRKEFLQEKKATSDTRKFMRKSSSYLCVQEDQLYSQVSLNKCKLHFPIQLGKTSPK